MKYFYLFVFVFMIQSTSWSQAAPNFWKDVRENEIQLSPNSAIEVFATKYRTLELDVEALSNYLLNAPKEFTDAAHSNPLSLSLPLPDGSFEEFEVIETSVMAPGLAARYPMIKSYKGVSKTKKSTNLRFDLTPKGFFASIFSVDGYKYIERIEDLNDLYYRVFDLKDLRIDESLLPSLSCGVDDIEDVIAPDHQSAQNAKSSYFGKLENRNNEPMVIRKYRLALACTGEFTQQKGGTSELALSSVNTALNIVNQIFLLETGVELELVDNNDEVIFIDPNTDPYVNATVGGQLLLQNTTVLNNFIGANNYDIGHVFTSGCSDVGGVVGAAICSQDKGAGVTCHSSNNINSIAIRIMAHEVGHQFTAGHSWNNCPGDDDIAAQISTENAFEPGSGSTIMSYSGVCEEGNNVQNFPDPYYNIGSLEDFIFFSREGNGNTCGFDVQSSNTRPTVTLPYEDDFFIPISTPFELNAIGSDPDGDEITYCWEQYDLGPSITLGNPAGNSPSFRSFEPTPDPIRVFPRIPDLVRGISRVIEVLPTYSRDLTFRCTVRDNNPEVGGVTWEEVAFKSTDQAGPFVVIHPNEENIVWEAGSYQEVTWDVANTNNQAVNCQSVNIRLSLDGGLTWPIMLLESTQNDGSTLVTIPNTLGTECRIRVEAADNIFFNISNDDFEIVEPTQPGYALSGNTDFLFACTPEELIIDFSTTSILGFENEVQLEVLSELPSGMTATFSNATITPGESTQLVLDLTRDFPSGTYSFDIQSTAEGLEPVIRTFIIEAYSVVYDDLTLLTPENGAADIILSTEFTWSEAINADEYRIEVATSPAFGESIIASNDFGPETEFFTPVPFENNTLHFWRVIPTNICGEGEATLPFGFHTQSVSCNVYENTTPVFISGTGLPTRESTIFVAEDGVISDVNIGSIIGSYQPVNSIRISLVSPAGTEVILFDQNCGTTANFWLGFDDEAPSEIICPPDDRFVLQPVGSLADFNGESTFGTWILRWQVVDPGFGGGGAIDAWNIEFCGAATAINPTVITNNPITVTFASGEQIRQADLEVQDDESTSDELTYTLVTLPEFGDLILDGQILAVGSQFSQTDINNFLFSYEHDGSEVDNDSFLFVVQDGTGGWIPNQQFNINIDRSTATEEILNETNVSIYPNPTKGSITIALQESIEEPLQLSILNVQGQQVLSNQIGRNRQQFELDLNDFPSGVYIINLQTTDAILSKKLVIQR